MKSSRVKKAFKILIANGVNLDLLGHREPSIYGTFSLSDLELQMRELAPPLANIIGISPPELDFYQTNNEVKFLEAFSLDQDGAIINPGAWTHTSLALADRLRALKLPFIEVHISNLGCRESYRQHSYLSPHAIGTISGLGMISYHTALMGLLQYLHNHPRLKSKSTFNKADK